MVFHTANLRILQHLGQVTFIQDAVKVVLEPTGEEIALHDECFGGVLAGLIFFAHLNRLEKLANVRCQDHEDQVVSNLRVDILRTFRGQEVSDSLGNLR